MCCGRSPRFAHAVLFGLFLVLLAASPALADRRILALSDIHFDPMADPGLVDRLNRAPAEEWPQIFAGAPDKSLGRYGRDTTSPLLASALAAMRRALPRPDFVVMTGDFLAHNFRARFDAAAKDHSEAAYRAFVRRTMRFLALSLERNFPRTPILPVLGNNDSYCGDYRLTPGGAFLKDTAPTMRRLVGAAASPGFARDWPRLGNYAARPPAMPRLRILALDTVVFSTRYKAACAGAAAGDPGERLLAWLAMRLAAAQRAREPVWLLFHVPSGIDDFATARAGSCPAKIVPLWQPRYAAAFAALLRRYQDTVAASLAGHLHTDTFRLGTGAGFTLVVPAISPIFGENPGFEMLRYDRAGRLADAATWALPGLSGSPAWREEYRFTNEWRLPRLDRASLAELYRRMGGDAPARARWLSLYALSSEDFWPREAAAREKRTRAAYCAAGEASATGFAACYCGAP